MIIGKEAEFAQFVIALNAFEDGHHTGHFNGRRYGVTIKHPVDARITKLFAEELGGSDYVSFNLFEFGDGELVLKPCEMASEKVIDFVLRFEPEQQAATHSTSDAVSTK